MTDGEDPSRRRPLLDHKRSERRFLRGVMGALAVAALVAFAAFASGLVDWAIQEGRGTPFVIQDINYSELATWCVIAGTLALIACFFLLRLGAARTLTAILALCFFVLVVGLDILFTLKETDGGVLSARRVGVVEAAVFLIAIAALLGQFDAARRGTGATALTTATAFLALGLVLFASAIWVFGGGWLGVPAGTPRPQARRSCGSSRARRTSATSLRANCKCPRTVWCPTRASTPISTRMKSTCRRWSSYAFSASSALIIAPATRTC
jgi:hypothetical protein